MMHNRHSIRLKEYDYTQPGGYFITCVAHDRECLFGEMIDGKMQLNFFGQVVKREWERLPSRFSNIELGAFVVMPNHFHGIILIKGRGTATDQTGLAISETRRAPTHVVERFGKPVMGSIPTMVRSFKSSVAFRINKMRGMIGTSVWQRNYYEHVIRNDQEMGHFHAYIEQNPQNWAEDRENIRRNL